MSDKDNEIAIVIACYDRPNALLRLLSSLDRAIYPERPIPLVISIDVGPQLADIREIAEKFIWRYGKKETRILGSHHGLREHILKCGDLSTDYRSIILLEEDLIVSDTFYFFASSALSVVGSDPTVAGISLYSPRFNEMAGLPFEPAPSQYDAYYMQSSQSWGQCWTDNMWRGFREWYLENARFPADDKQLPLRVTSWPATSWKKHHMRYICATNRTWLYPYISHTSNTSIPGSHAKRRSYQYQVALARGRKDFFIPERFSDESVHYDVFMERCGLTSPAGVKLTLDLYGTRRVVKSGEKLVTSRRLDVPHSSSYGVWRWPHDENILNSCEGDQFRVYDVGEEQKLDGRKKKRMRQYYATIDWRDALIFALAELFHRFRDRFATIVRGSSVGGRST